MTQPASGDFSVSLERGLTILSAFSSSRPVLGIADLARIAGVTKSTAHRYVATLANLGFAAIESMDLTRVAAPLLQSLADETGFTVSMAVCESRDVVYVDRRRSGRRNTLAIDLNLHVGSRLPAYCTALGKAILAFKEPQALRQILERSDMARRGPNTITNREQLMVTLAKVRQNGIAVNDEELAPGLRSFAAPIRDRTGEVIAAVNVAVHMSAAPASLEALTAQVEPHLRRTAREISQRLGHRSGN
jgi:IclR family pca regulon transcriptional regulator